jgi:hypothetical protein
MTRRKHINPEDCPPCACGCGERTTNPRARFRLGHNKRIIAGQVKKCRFCGQYAPTNSFGRFNGGKLRHDCPDCVERRTRFTSRFHFNVDDDGTPILPSVEHIDPSFAHWLAGFVDGEGCFTIAYDPPGYSCWVSIQLRRDDEPVLQEIRDQTGVGAIRRRGSRGSHNPQSTWAVASKKDCLLLVALFDKFPLRAKKRRDYLIWREAVIHWCRVSGRYEGDKRRDWQKMAEYKESLAAVRRFAG